MFKDIQVTLYDFFGYLLPGALILCSIVILFWAVFWPSFPLSIPAKLPPLEVGVLLFVAYLAGHLGQGLANLMDKLFKTRVKFEKEIPLSAELSETVKSAIGSRFGENIKSLSSQELFRLCDQTLLHCDSLGEREIFTYREGFYRGNWIALAALTFSVIVRLIHTPIHVDIFGTAAELWRPHLLTFAMLTGLGSYLAFCRYLRFAAHGYRTCFLRFLSAKDEVATKS